MQYYQKLGFENHPFVHTNADEEPFLERYFVPPPFFDGVVGDPQHPSSCVVLAPRGGGKSAQRRRLEIWASQNAVLGVTYDRFEFASGQQLEDIGLTYHIRNIIIRTLITYLSFLQDTPTMLYDLDKQTKKTLSLFVHSYLGELNGHALQSLLNELRSIPESIKKFWSENVGILESLVNVLLSKYGLEKIDLPDVRQEEKRLDATYKIQLEILRNLINQKGFKAIYILIDKLDETEKTGNNPEKSYQLIKPLIQDLELLGLQGYGFKFFLWNQILPFFRIDARPDRVPQYELKWERKTLETVLSRRLSAFSNSAITSFFQLLSRDPGYPIDSILCILANRSPRNLIRICEKIFSAHAENPQSEDKISPENVDRGIILYAEQVTLETYGTDVCRDLQRVGRELFTINYLASEVFKTTHENTSRNKVTNWQQVGIVTQTGTVYVEDRRRPLNFYQVIDPAMIRLIHRAEPLYNFIKDRWLPCKHCGLDIIMDITLIPERNDPVCHNCNRNLL